MTDNQLREAASALDDANKGLQQAFIAWSEAVSTLHLAELELRKSQQKMARAFSILTAVLPEQG
jgi:exonuclease VII small subunit